MIALNGEDCLFYAIVLTPNTKEDESVNGTAYISDPAKSQSSQTLNIYKNFIDVTESENGVLESISFHNEDRFNFAFDIVDEIAKRAPDKLAMLHLDKHKTERRFSFADIKRASAQCANYFKSLGIRRGDRVMLV